MKKRLILLTLLFFLIPLNIKAYTMEKFLMDITVIDNGDIHIKELYRLNGEYNGSLRTINYKSKDSKTFNGSLDSFESSEIYNGESVEILNIKGINKQSAFSFEDFELEGYTFTRVTNANIGDYGKYILTETSNGVDLKIFTPHYRQNIIYIEYLIKNVIVVHEDVAELYFNIFDDTSTETIGSLQAYINLPGNSKELLVWGHGPYNGEIDPIDKTLVFYRLPFLNSKTPLDYRIVFDKEVVENSTKKTNIQAKDLILQVEQKRADDANLKRTQDKQIMLFTSFIAIAWFFAFVYNIISFYKKYDKEHESNFKTKYFRDFPREYGPEIVSYLSDKKIDTKDLSASLLNLISKKNINYEGQKDYTLILDNEENLTESEQKLVDWFFKEIGEENKVTLKQINKASKKYSEFLKNYEQWKKIVLKEAINENFYENNKKDFKYFIIPLAGFLIMLIPTYEFLMFITIIISIIGLIYMFSVTKRTKQGNEEYRLWMGLKNFLNDFGNFKERELPHIELWEKYLVYAMSFGIANKLAKNMKIKFKELEKQGQVSAMDLYYINRMNILNNSIGNSINSSVRSARAAQTRASSGSGAGGGFSGGGGFGGGGGSVGRF